MSPTWQRHRFPLLGLVYLLVLGLLATLSVLAYRKDLPWQRSVDVTLVTTRPGLELNPGSDVKLQGRIVGRVDSIDSDGSTATVHLALDPDEVHLVPAVVDAAIVPKTLFGEKFVDLLVPDGASAARIAEGDVIRQSTTATEIGDLYAGLVPLLRAVDPAQLSTVLNTLARTLEGRGAQLGRVISRGNEFLGELNPHLDALRDDVVLLDRTLQVYDEAAPDLLDTLANTAAISDELLVPSEQRLARLLDELVSTSDAVEEVVGENADAVVTLTGRVRPLLEVLDYYSESLPCSLRGLHTLDKMGNQVSGSRGPYTLLNVDLLVQGDPYVYPRDLPSNPDSEANNANLPAIVPNWRPHCPRFSTLAKTVRDAGPFTQEPLDTQAIQDPTAPLPDVPGAENPAGIDPRLAQALGDLLTGRRAGTARPGAPSGLSGLLLGPMLYDGEVEVP